MKIDLTVYLAGQIFLTALAVLLGYSDVNWKFAIPILLAFQFGICILSGVI